MLIISFRQENNIHKQNIYHFVRTRPSLDVLKIASDDGHQRLERKHRYVVLGAVLTSTSAGWRMRRWVNSARTLCSVLELSHVIYRQRSTSRPHPRRSQTVTVPTPLLSQSENYYLCQKAWRELLCLVQAPRGTSHPFLCICWWFQNLNLSWGDLSEKGTFRAGPTQVGETARLPSRGSLVLEENTFHKILEENTWKHPYETQYILESFKNSKINMWGEKSIYRSLWSVSSCFKHFLKHFLIWI